jgi:hypothetical protein
LGVGFGLPKSQMLKVNKHDGWKDNFTKRWQGKQKNLSVFQICPRDGVKVKNLQKKCGGI